LPTFLRGIHFESNHAGNAVIQGLGWLKDKKNAPPMGVIGKAWNRYVVTEEGEIDPMAYTFCVLDKLHSAFIAIEARLKH
jgi:hypothetical protein